jgi:hypothetical protein
MEDTETYNNSYKHEELDAAAIRNCRAKNGDFSRSPGNFIPAGTVVMGMHGSVTARCDIRGFSFASMASFKANASIDVDGERIPVMAHIQNNQIVGDFFARREGGFFCGNRKVSSRKEARDIGCFGHAKDPRIVSHTATDDIKI